MSVACRTRGPQQRYRSIFWFKRPASHGKECPDFLASDDASSEGLRLTNDAGDVRFDSLDLLCISLLGTIDAKVTTDLNGWPEAKLGFQR